MKTAIVVFAGAMFASMAMATVSDQSSEERYRAKYGRYTPAQESRLKDVQAASAVTATEPAGPVCCRSWHRHDRLVVSTSISTDRFRNAVTATSSEEARFVAKYGRIQSVPDLATGIDSAPCEHTCCQHGL